MSPSDEAVRRMVMQEGEPCNCEHEIHDRGEGHPHMGVRAGSSRAFLVGLVCDPCAATCMEGLLVQEEGPS